jgi:hypothetical protein
MDRRSFLRGVGVGTVAGTAGCIGGGGKVVVNVQREISVRPRTGWIKEIPDVSNPGGAISYVSRASDAYDVYFFTSAAQVEQYQAFTDGEEPDHMPPGDRTIGGTATAVSKDTYRATSRDDGGRQSIGASGPYYFVLDNSNYPTAGGAYLRDPPTERSIYLDLTVSKQRFGL